MEQFEEILQPDETPTRPEFHDGDHHMDDQLVRLRKTVVISPHIGKKIDASVVNHQFYDHFKYSLLPKEHSQGKLTLGITSPNPGEGKTLVASNLAASLAMANQRETLLIDLNVNRPRVHEIFGVPLAPGLLEGLQEPKVCICKTKVKHLSVLTVGSTAANPIETMRLGGSKNHMAVKAAVGLDQLTDFRNMLFSLEEKFELLIVDLPSINESAIPTLFTSQLGGVIVVVNAGKTKQRDIDRLLVTLNENQVLGFVFNRVNKNNLQ
jgi:Mrp family chromosome partitioning ATPase